MKNTLFLSLLLCLGWSCNKKEIEKQPLRCAAIASEVFGFDWEIQSLQKLSNRVVAVDFPSSDAGYIVEEDIPSDENLRIASYEVNRGQYVQITTLPKRDNEVSFDFVDKQHGFLAFYDLLCFENCGNLLYKTVDGGNNWKEINLTLPGVMTLLKFHTPNDGFAILRRQLDATNWDYLLAKTTDGGETWSVQEDVLLGDITERKIVQPTPTHFYISNGLNGSFYRSKDGGSTWQSLNTPGKVCTDIYFLTAEIGWATFSQEIHDQKFELYKTTDGGETWNKTSSENITSILSFQDDQNFLSMGKVECLDREGIVDDSRALFSSNDNGVTWKAGIFPENFYHFNFPSSEKGFAIAVDDKEERILVSIKRK